MAQKYDQSTLAKKTKADLVEIAEELDLETKGLTKPDLIMAIAEAQNDDADEVDDDELDDEVDDSDDEVDEDEELDDIADPDLEEEEIEVDEVEEEPVKKTRSKSTKKTTTSKPAAEGDTLAAKQVASLVGTDAKTIRQFFRSDASTTEPVGSGGRYEFLETDVPKIKAEFEKWSANRGKRSAGTGGSSSKKARQAAKVEAEIEEVEEIEELEEAELDDEIDDDDIELED